MGTNFCKVSGGRRLAVRCAAGLIGAAILCRPGGPARAAPTDVVSREISVWNNPASSALGSWDSTSREVTVWNDPRITSQGFADSMSREVTLWNDPRYTVLGIPDILTREVTVQAGPVIVQNGALALKGAGGLLSIAAGQMATLNVVTADTSASRVDIRDAVRLVRKAAGLDP